MPGRAPTPKKRKTPRKRRIPYTRRRKASKFRKQKQPGLRSGGPCKITRFFEHRRTKERVLFEKDEDIPVGYDPIAINPRNPNIIIYVDIERQRTLVVAKSCVDIERGKVIVVPEGTKLPERVHLFETPEDRKYFKNWLDKKRREEKAADSAQRKKKGRKTA